MYEAIDRSLLEFIVERLEAGVFVVDRNYRVVLWNRFMAMHSQRSAEEVVGRNLFECFPELPQKWLARKIESVFILKNYAFTSWEQRPFLFRFNHNRPITGGIDAMLTMSTQDLMTKLQSAPVTRCDQPQWYFLGLTMAGWNAICSAILTGMWLRSALGRGIRL